MSTTKGRFRRAIGFVPLLPIAIVFVAEMTILGIEFRLRKRRSRKYFRQGLAEAGLHEEEAKLLAGEWG
jgi:hypothetical protein